MGVEGWSWPVGARTQGTRAVSCVVRSCRPRERTGRGRGIGGRRTDVDVLRRVDEPDRRVRAGVLGPVLHAPVGCPQRAVEEGVRRGLVAAVLVVGDGRRDADVSLQGAEVVEAVVREGGGCRARGRVAGAAGRVVFQRVLRGGGGGGEVEEEEEDAQGAWKADIVGFDVGMG